MATNTKNKIGIIEGTLVYAKVGQPDKRYQEEGLDWSIEVIVDEDAAEAWDDQYQKQKARKVKASDFEAKYRIPCPIPGAKNVYSIKLKRAATDKAGAPVDDYFRPKVYIDSVNDEGESERTEVGQSRKLANGCFGKVSYYISTNDYGTFARLQNVLMDESGFLEYESSGGGMGSEFGSSKPVKTEAARSEVMSGRPPRKVVEVDEVVVKKAGVVKKAVPPIDEFEDCSPF